MAAQSPPAHTPASEVWPFASTAMRLPSSVSNSRSMPTGTSVCPIALSTMSASTMKRSSPPSRDVRANSTPVTTPPSPINRIGVACVTSVTPLVCAKSRSAQVALIASTPRRYTIVTDVAPSLRLCTAASTAVLPPPITTTRRPTGTVPKSLACAPVR